MAVTLWMVHTDSPEQSAMVVSGMAEAEKLGARVGEPREVEPASEQVLEALGELYARQGDSEGIKLALNEFLIAAAGVIREIDPLVR